jgi:hypothetical protein
MVAIIIFLLLLILGAYVLFSILRRLIDAAKKSSTPHKEGGLTTCTGIKLPPMHQECTNHSLVQIKKKQCNKQRRQYQNRLQARNVYHPKIKISWMQLLILDAIFCEDNNHSCKNNDYQF